MTTKKAVAFIPRELLFKVEPIGKAILQRLDPIPRLLMKWDIGNDELSEFADGIDASISLIYEAVEDLLGTGKLTKFGTVDRSLTARVAQRFVASKKQARLIQLVEQHWHNLTMPEKHAAMKRLAHKPILESQGLTKQAVQQGLAFMVYKINADTHNSKFYEGLIIPDTDGYRVIRRWGALTDSGQTGRIDGAKSDEDLSFWFPNIQSAKHELQEHYRKRMAHGYIDAFGSAHVSPVDGKKLPMGQYPVGLTRKPGFGWGTQSVTQCIPNLKYIVDDLTKAQQEIDSTKQSTAVFTILSHALDLIQRLTHEDSTMAAKLKQMMSRPLRRVQEYPRFLPDPEGIALKKELQTITNYLRKQLSFCS